MLPNDFVVFWEHDNHPSRYVNKFDGSYDLMTKYTGTWELYINIPENLAARAFHEAESVYALVDRSKPDIAPLVDCPMCGGDGKETCDNPDHGFISAVGGETGRLGCPVCGHDPDHKVPNGGACDLCAGACVVTADTRRHWMGDNNER